MRSILVIALACVAAYGLFLLGGVQPGNYVKIYVGVYLWEMSFVEFLVFVFILFLAWQLFFWLVKSVWRMPSSFSGWRTRRAHKKADAALGSGYLSLIKGDWKRAEKSLVSKTDASRVPYVNYLAAAQAAQEQGRLVSRDEYLNAAYKAAPKERLAIGLTKARLHQSAGQWEQAAATLVDIADIGQSNAQFTAMLMQTHQELGNWDKAIALLPVARKQQALPVEILDKIYNDAHTASLRGATDKDLAWKKLPKEQRKRVANVALYASFLIQGGDGVAAEKLIRTTLKSDWSDELVHLYGDIPSDKPGKLRRVVEGWLMARPENAELNLAAGQFAIREKNLELAKEYLQKAIELAQLPKAYALLGDVYESANESGKALQLFRAGMHRMAKTTDAELIQEVTGSSSGELILASQPTSSND